MAFETKIAKKDPRAWDALPGFPEWAIDAMTSMGFARATPVQSSVWPLWGTGNKDVVVEAVTGSGKTLAFLIPLVHRILRLEEATKRHHVAAIVIAPTRELSQQIHTTLKALISFHPESAGVAPYLSGEEKRPATTSPSVVPQLLSGGSTTTPSQDVSFFLRHSPNLIISTPGRLVELLSSPHVHCSQSSFEALVLDEADRLLDLGFKSDLQSILSRLPKQRRTGLFSASVSEAVSEIIRVGLRNPVKISVKVKTKLGEEIKEQKTPASLQMTYLMAPAQKKIPRVLRLLQKLEPRPLRSIIFLSTCAGVEYFSHIIPSLLPEGYLLVPLHGKQDAKIREKNVSRFLNATEPSVLLTTDVAARGLDFPQVDLVLQMDPPTDAKTFLHRCGRAGRAGRRGLSIVLVEPHEETYIPFLDVRKTPITPFQHFDVSVEDQEANITMSKIREMVKKDRALYDKAQKGFVSWVRSYSKHTASSIFRISDIDWVAAANAWGLLRLPKMPEAKSYSGDRSLGQSINWDTYAYANPTREKQRLAALKEYTDPAIAAEETEARQARKRRNTEAWSGKHEAEETRTTRRDKKQRKREAARKEKMTDEEKSRDMDLAQLLAAVRKQNREKGKDDEGEGNGGAHVDADDFEGFD
ncbi:ATP-dependent rRNA helicase SPB4 [Xylariaceae sp. FL0255]|nr:ATP-dependent rRNA helicase SPB4 [Xylariaceae sp. FL0255]